MDDARIEAEIVHTLASRDLESSCCPSEVARALEPRSGEHWRELMPRVRAVVAVLAGEQRVLVTRGSRVLPPGDLDGGPIRLRRGPRFDVGAKD